MIQVRKHDTVLLIDSEKHAATALRATLGASECTFWHASTAAEGLAIRERSDPDLIVCRGPLRDMDEVELVSRLKRLPGGENIPVLLALGTSSAESRYRGYEAGASEILDAPLDIRLLGMRAASWLRDKVARDELTRSRDQLALERDRLEQRRQELEAMVEFVGHDLKSPLQVTMMGIEWVHRHLSGDRPALGGYLEEALGAARRTQALIQDLICSFTGERGAITARKTRSELAATLRAVLDVERYAAARKGVVLQHSFEPDIEVDIDERLLQRVLFNLLENSLRFTPASGVISLSAREERDVVIEVVNTGRPVREAEQQQIFEKYVRGSEEDSQGPNVGLGLFFCKRVIEAHGGVIDVSRTTELATCFRLRLPKAGQPVVGN